MDTIDLLHEFARTQDIAPEEVTAFLNSYEKPKTFEQIMDLPHDMQTHYTYISSVPEPLQSFISEELYCDRYETLSTDRVVDHLLDEIYSLLKEEHDDIEEVGIANLTTDVIADTEQLEKLKAIAQQVLDIKFGSVVMDW